MLRRRHVNRLGKVLLDLIILGSAFCLAFMVRFEGAVPTPFLDLMVIYLPFVVIGKLALMVLSGRLRPTWRHTSLRDTVWIFNCTAMSGSLLLAWRLFSEGVFPSLQPVLDHPLPIGVILLDLGLSFLGLVGARAAVRLWCENHERRAAWSATKQVPTVLIGAGRAGAMVAKEIGARPDLGIAPIGFLDDDPNLKGLEINGLAVLGATSQLDEIVKRHQVRQALITIASGSGPAIRRILEICEANGLATKIIPPLHEIVGGHINLSRIRKVALEDLLRRNPVKLDSHQLRALVEGQTVLVSGAGGSIGSELCKIISALGPETLVLVERAENNLFQVHLRLREMFPKLRIIPCIADICDEGRMDAIFALHRPALVFHAAAHKHVPMMEWNPSEAVKNNVLGTRMIAGLADHWGVDRFVMISTDKAVNPSSVMGVSKRVAELVVQSFRQRSKTRFMAVRFGNVLGSAGSVIPIFQQQIESGGPVTITHPDMKRYFMTIPEACQLVLQAASMGKGGETFILDMGEPVKIVDIARDLITLSGLAPDRDIEIRFTGIRPGEKLSEELFLGAEDAKRTRHPRIFIGQVHVPDWSIIERQVKELGKLADRADTEEIYAKFKEIVPEYQYERDRLLPASDPALPVRVGLAAIGTRQDEGVVLGNNYV